MQAVFNALSQLLLFVHDEPVLVRQTTQLLWPSSTVRAAHTPFVCASSLGGSSCGLWHTISLCGQSTFLESITLSQTCFPGPGSPDRMDFALQCGDSSPHQDQDSSHQPLRLCGEHATAHLLHLFRRPMGLGHGCASSLLDQDAGLCISSNIPNSADSFEGRLLAMPTTSHRSVQASPILVPLSDQIPHGNPGVSTKQTGPPLSTGVSSSSSGSGQPPLDLLAIVKYSFCSAGVSDEAPEMVTHD